MLQLPQFRHIVDWSNHTYYQSTNKITEVSILKQQPYLPQNADAILITIPQHSQKMNGMLYHKPLMHLLLLCNNYNEEYEKCLRTCNRSITLLSSYEFK